MQSGMTSKHGHSELLLAQHFCILQVLTSAQNTAWMVATYPSLLTAPIFTTLARRHKKPVMHDVLGQPPPADTLSNWGHVSKYVYSITVHNMLTYVPFLPNIEEAHGGAS